METYQPYLRCKYCSGTIRLPYPNHPEISAGQPDWPKDTWSAVVQCPSCDTSYRYLAQDALWQKSSKLALGTPHSPTIVYCIEFRCDQVLCNTQTKLHVLRDADVSISDVEQAVRQGRIVATCISGHPTAVQRMLKVYPVSEIA